MGLRQDITARAIESGRTFDQQAAYERFMGDASTVAAQREAGVIDAIEEATEEATEEGAYSVTTTAGAAAGVAPYAYTHYRDHAIAAANELHAVRVKNGADGTDSVRVEYRGRVLYAIRDNGEIIL